jgi:hypothetical protein
MLLSAVLGAVCTAALLAGAARAKPIKVPVRIDNRKNGRRDRL